MHNMMVLSPVLLYGCWRNARLSIAQCLDMAPPEILRWSPREGMRTFGDLIDHVCVVADRWFSNVIKDGDMRSALALTTPYDKELLSQRLLYALDRSDRFVRDGNCYELYTSNGKTCSGTWIILHLYMHDIYHCGQLKSYLRLYGLTPPPWLE